MTLLDGFNPRAPYIRDTESAGLHVDGLSAVCVDESGKYGFLFLYLIGGLTGIPNALTALDLHIHDTHFIVARFWPWPEV